MVKRATAVLRFVGLGALLLFLLTAGQPASATSVSSVTSRTCSIQSFKAVANISPNNGFESADCAAGWGFSSEPSSTGSQERSVQAHPYPESTVSIYRWASGAWQQQARIRGWIGPFTLNVVRASLTGSKDPDFVTLAGEAADTTWLAVISHVGGKWHIVPFEYGYGLTTVVNGSPMAHGILTYVDATASASGPTTQLYETYKDGAFRPAPPTGRSPACNSAWLDATAAGDGLNLVSFSKVACAAGWAMAVGTGGGYSGQVVGLFDENKGNWSVAVLDNGENLGADTGIYDIPESLLLHLGSQLGQSLRPALATAALIDEPVLSGLDYQGGVIAADGSLWFVGETATGEFDSPGANATVYRWSGSRWVALGTIDHVPSTLNAVEGGWFEAVTIRGTTTPGFTDGGQAVLSDAGGTWHVARINS